MQPARDVGEAETDPRRERLRPRGSWGKEQVARLKARVETFCVGCGLCAEACPEVFELPEGAEAVRVKASEVPVGAEEACRQAADQCPVDNIRVEA